MKTILNCALLQKIEKDFNPTINEEVLLEWIVNNPLQDIENEYEINANKSIDEVVNQMLLVLSP